MKKFLPLLLACILACSCFSSALAALDISALIADESVYTVDIDEEQGSAFVESLLTASDRSYVHTYESENRYSTTRFDILVVDYGQETAYPVMRLWVNYCADDGFKNFDAVSFVVGGKQYTFSEVGDPGWRESDEQGYVEQMLIRFGAEDLVFLQALLKEMMAQQALAEADDSAALLAAMNSMDVRMILHGDEELEVQLGAGFLMDYLAIQTAMMSINGMDYVGQVVGTAMTVTDLD